MGPPPLAPSLWGSSSGHTTHEQPLSETDAGEGPVQALGVGPTGQEIPRPRAPSVYLRKGPDGLVSACESPRHVRRAGWGQSTALRSLGR